MKSVFALFLLFASTHAFALDKQQCQQSIQVLDAVIPKVKGIGLSPYTNEVVRLCGVNAAPCENDEPGYAYFSYKAFCVSQTAKALLRAASR